MINKSLIFQHLEFRKQMKIDAIITDWRPPEVKKPITYVGFRYLRGIK